MWNFNSFENNIAVTAEDGSSYSYGDLDGFSKSLGNELPSRSLVFILCTNTIGSLAGYVGFLQHRIVPLLLDSNIDPKLLNDLVEAYHPSFLWVPRSKASVFQYSGVYESLDYVLLKTDLNPYILHEDLALLLTTSGSTGSPKLVRQSYLNIRSNMESIAEYLGIISDDRSITTLPMNYTYGLSIINSYLYRGAMILQTEKTLMQKEFWLQFKTQQATSFSGVPYTYEILNKLRFFRMDLPSLKTMTQAGGRLSPELHKAFAEYAFNNNKRFFVMYGQTEATARMSYLPPEHALAKCGSMGIAIPGGRFELIDETGSKINDCNTVGELVYYGKNVMLGYAACGSDLAKGDEHSGVLYTGDMARCDEKGFYFIAGRKKRFLKIFGNRVNLDETELLVRSSYHDIECACVGVDDKMVVYITDEDKCHDIQSFLASKTGLNFVAFDVKYISTIPKNEAGKILYSKL